VYQPKTKLDLTKEVEVSKFAFDNVYDETSNNMDIYNSSVKDLIPGVFHGKWASVFAYGQSGSGKTFTMMGSNLTGMKAGNQVENISEANLGLYFLAAQDVFYLAQDPQYEDISINCSLFEIYGGKLLDLLNERNPIRCLEDSKGKVCFPGLSEHPVQNAEDLMDIIEAGSLNRSTGQTQANADSSRSHAVLQLSLRKDVGRSRRNIECGKRACLLNLNSTPFHIIF
jgi:kinesin family protein 2/24